MDGSFLFSVGIIVLTVLVILLARISEQRLEPTDNGAKLESGELLTTQMLYVNVGFSQVLVSGLVIALVWLGGLSPRSLGITSEILVPLIGGIVLGCVLFIGNELSVVLFSRIGIPYSESLRSSLAPSTKAGWIILLGGVLPLIAIGEELLFRAALIGGLSTTTGLPVLLLIILSSIAFAIGHGVQGPGGVVVTGVLGVVLGIVFAITASLILVVVAHYVVNVLEFVINEGFDVSWGRSA